MTRSRDEWREPVWRRVRRFWGPNVEADVDEELRFHLEMRAAELERRGLSPEEARREATTRFGSVDRARGECREIGRRRRVRQRRTQLLDELRQDVALALRGLRRRPGWSVSVAVTLGLGLAATATIFSIVNAVLVRPLPVRDADRLVAIASYDPGESVPGSVSYPNYRDIRALRGTFSDAIAWSLQFVSVRQAGRADGAERRNMMLVSDNYFVATGVRPALGRFFTPEEALRREPLLVLSHRAWQEHYGGDSSVVGRAVHVNGIPATIVGVGPAGFTGVQPMLLDDGWLPVTLYQQLVGAHSDPLERRQAGRWKVMAWRAPGVEMDEARAALDVLAARLGRDHPDVARGIRFASAPETRARPDLAVSGALPRVAAVFMTLVGLVLLVACANVAGLLLVRAAARQGELAVRSALGAGRGRLVRQLLTEATVLALAGTAIGLALATLAARALGSVRLSTDAPVSLDVSPDWRVFAFALAAALVAALASGLAPALRASRVSLSAVLKEGGRSATAGRARQRLRGGLVALQVAVTFLLLACAGLLVRGVQRTVRVDVGFRTGELAMASADVSLARHDAAQEERFFARLAEETRALPGVRSVAYALTTPLGYNHEGVTVFADVPALQPQDGRLSLFTNSVSPGWFETLGVPLLDGRDFTVHDDSAAAPVAVVNAALAHRLWPEGSALGRQLRLSQDGRPVTVVGVVGDTKEMHVSEETRPMIYFPFAQRPSSDRTLFVRTAGDPAALLQPLRDRAAAVDPAVALYDVKTMHAHLYQGMAFLFSRLAAALAVAFGALALVQALAGLYGLLAYAVGLRTREIGLRMALGARDRDVLRAVLGDGARLTLVGLAIGLPLALAATRLLGALLHGVSATDPLAFGGAALLLLLATLAAAFLPARRAARVSPGEALRAE